LDLFLKLRLSSLRLSLFGLSLSFPPLDPRRLFISDLNCPQLIILARALSMPSSLITLPSLFFAF